MRRFLLFCGCCCLALVVRAQFVIGTTGLMQLPTADMQREKTVMLGWGWLDSSVTPQAYGWDKDPTMNYYMNITVFPWLEISYDCTLIRGKYMADRLGAAAVFLDKWANQDRNFSFRLRAWKEGWWKSWTPQVVVGVNDALHTSSKGSSGHVGVNDSGNGFWGRMYAVATKHIELPYVGTAGLHAAYFHNRREDFRYEGIGAGANFVFDRLNTGVHVVDKVLRPLNLMAEYDTRTFNVGAVYSIWRDHINFIGEMNAMKHFSGGVFFRLHLK